MREEPRRQQLRQWVETQLGAAPSTFEPASQDASFRRYFRARVADISFIVMDAPPEHEDCRPFVRVAALMADAGVHVPRVIAQDLERGFLLLSDLGTVSYLHALNEDNADALFLDAMDALVRWQLASRPGVLPPYDEALLRRELELFPQWYLQSHCGMQLDRAQRQALDALFTRIVASNLAQPCVYVHRDYMPRNLMVCEPNPGVLDFQDAVFGPITYDIASLFRDAFISWDEARVIDWTARYWERAKRAGLPVAHDFGAFYRDCEWMAAQRHLKVLGIFARLHYRDGKAGYLEDTPRFVDYLRAAAARYSALSPLQALLDAGANRAGPREGRQS
ncbi:MAG TPA: phosphotransferase [Burkholderiales bacterium]|nr:phosphotransferase [Burkholderiales bacterium]